MSLLLLLLLPLNSTDHHDDHDDHDDDDGEDHKESCSLKALGSFWLVLEPRGLAKANRHARMLSLLRTYVEQCMSP